MLQDLCERKTNSVSITLLVLQRLQREVYGDKTSAK